MTESDDRSPQIRAYLEHALESGIAQLHIDPQVPGTQLPEELRQRSYVVLNLSYRFDPPDLAIDDWGVRETLSFAGVRYMVAIPWRAIFGVAENATRELWTFPAHLPPGFTESEAAKTITAAKPSPEAKADVEPGRRGHLRLVK